MNTADWVRRCERALAEHGVHFGHGTDNPRDEAAWLVLHVLGEPLDGSFDAWDDPVPEAAARRIEALLAERIDSRRPLAQLLGEAWFCGLRFQVTPDVLVPRSPIGELILREFEPWAGRRPFRRALDIGTGSGCIAIAMAVHLPGLTIDAGDVSEAALAVARANAQAHGVADRVRLRQSDAFDAWPGVRWDLIVSNPPYVGAGHWRALPPEYRAEPEQALVSGADGLDLPLRLLARAADHLRPAGLLVMEVGENAEPLQRLLPRVPFTWLEFEHGGEGVFTMERPALRQAQSEVLALMEKRSHVR